MEMGTVMSNSPHLLDLLDVAVVAAHPIRVQKVRGSGFVFPPQMQWVPRLAVGATVRSARPSRDGALGRDENGSGPRDAPPCRRRFAITLACPPQQPIQPVDAQLESAAFLPGAKIRLAKC